MRRARHLMAFAVVMVAASAPASAQGGDHVCSRFEPVELGGTLTEPRLIELSGLAASRQHPGVLWAHNDSGGAPELFAMGEDGSALGAHPVEGAIAIDWEDMASGPGADGTGDFLYAGDIGDNEAARPSVTVYRVPEPAAVPTAPGTGLGGVEAIELVYPDGPADAEALLIDPRTGDLVIVTKSLLGASRVLEVDAASTAAEAPVAMSDAGGLQVRLPPEPGGRLPGTMVTGGDVSPDGSIVLLRTYQSVLAFARDDDETLAEALVGEPCFGPQEEEPQGEAVAFTGDGSAYVTASEGSTVPIHRVALTTRVTTTTTATSTVPTTTTTTAPRADDTDGEWSMGTVVIGVIGLAVLTTGALVWLRRSRASGAG